MSNANTVNDRGAHSSRVTIADVAREAVVSKATVSMALRGMPEISAGTREKVVAVARRLGYRADPSLSRIAASRWRNRTAEEGSVLAFIDFGHEGESSDMKLSRKGRPSVEGARLRAGELGYKFDYRQVETPRELQQVTRVLHHRGVQGVVLSSAYSEDFFEVYPWDRFATVAEGDHCATPPVDTVSLDNYGAIRLAVEKALGGGRRRIGLVLSEDSTRIPQNLVFQGVFECLMRSRSMDGACATSLVFGSEQYFSLLQWIRSNRLDAVISYTSDLLGPLQSLGLQSPEECAFISMQASAEDDSIAGVRDVQARIGSLSVEHVDELLRCGRFGRPEEKTNYAVASAWTEGQSFESGSSEGEDAAETRAGHALAAG